MLGTSLAQEFLDSVILSGQIEGIKPLSALLIAEPELGKTSLATLRTSELVIPVNDTTGRGIYELVEKYPRSTHFVIQDLTIVSSKRANVNAYLQLCMMALVEEGLTIISDPTGVRKIENGIRGIIACLTPNLATSQQRWWNTSGFSSRFIPFGYRHDVHLKLRIKDAIDTGMKFQKSIHPLPVNDKSPLAKIKIEIPEKQSSELRKMADAKSTELRETGYRRLKHFRGLAQGHAALRKSKKVGPEDTKFIENCLPYISYTEQRAL